MKFPWRSDKGRVASENAGASHTSEIVVESRVVPGVRFTIAKISFARRMELMRQVRDLARRTSFLAASDDAGEQMDAALLRAEIERVYVMWGIKAVAGLAVDGKAAGPELLAEAGPENLFQEALAVVRRETGLSEEERKNS
jgi:hypothetical protein